ncbi:MAG: hypothetical protein IT363_05150 [Methanoregulaceae archaeon]|nr:hypothetical protein [Methanoregulaceae archaeon]
MTLNAYAAKVRLSLFDDLKAGRDPGSGSWDATQLAEARAKGSPQVGTTRYTPDALWFEFIYSGPTSTPIIVTVKVPAPERIVFLPVPDWVIETIWQGDIDGSYHFESHARSLVQQFADVLEPHANLVWFGPRAPKRRE